MTERNENASGLTSFSGFVQGFDRIKCIAGIVSHVRESD